MRLRLKESWIDSQNKIENMIEDILRNDETFQDKDRASEFLEGIINFVRSYAKENNLFIDDGNIIEGEDSCDATQVEDIAKKEEYMNLVTPSFKIGKKISLEESTYGPYNELVFDNEGEAKSKMDKVIQKLQDSFKDIEDYDFDYRIEDGNIKLFDKNEFFYNNSRNFNKVEKIVQNILSDEVYLEPENSVIMTIADCYIKGGK